MKDQVNTPLAVGELVNKYHVGFHLRPTVASVVQEQIVQMICHLELRGHHKGAARRCDARCQACIQVLEALFEVAWTLRTIEREMSEKVGGICTTRLHYASTAESEHQVRLGIEMTLRQPMTGAAGGWTWIFLQRVRATLSELGCGNCSLAAPARGKLGLEHRRAADAKSTPLDSQRRESRMIA